MTERGFSLFDTAVGKCGIAWGERGVVGVQLPEGRDAATRGRLVMRFPAAPEAEPPPHVEDAVRAIAALLEGAEGDLTDIVLDMEGVPPFHRRVYEAARKIGPGATLSYGELARRLGAPGSARAVGQALGRNPFAIVVPCHRVLAASGKLGGFSANGGVTTKLRLLNIERKAAQRDVSHFDGDGVLSFEPDVALQHLRQCDERLARLIDAVGPFRMAQKKTSSLFHALAEAIVYQQLNGRAAATIFARVCALFPGGHEGLSPAAVLRASDERLRGAGLSANKLLSLKDLAKRAKAGEIPTLAEAHGMTDDAIIERLTEVRGIGRWTVEMLLMFRLGRPDVLPVDDYGVRKGYAVAFRKREMPAPKALAKVGEAWQPYRSVVSWYFWRAAELGKI
jgi:methylated-DNA-[protein]-cysteine S-methyltransferase